VVPSFESAASMFPEMSFIQCLPFVGCKQYDIITALICIIEGRRYLWDEKGCSGKRDAILVYFGGPFR